MFYRKAQCSKFFLYNEFSKSKRFELKIAICVKQNYKIDRVNVDVNAIFTKNSSYDTSKAKLRPQLLISCQWFVCDKLHENLINVIQE